MRARGCAVTDLLLSAAVERPGTGLSPRAWLNGRISALLATTALVAVAALLPGAARALVAVQGATRRATPATGDFNTGTNWSPATVPTGTAFFGTSSIISLSSSANTTIGGWTFNAGALAYSFTNGNVLKFTGAGIVINGGSATITNNVSGFLQFFNTSTAGSASITNNWGLQFYDTSTAGSASITNNNNFLYFYNTSTAGSASITNNAGGDLYFTNTSTAGSASITNNGASSTLNFNHPSTAGSASITNNGGALYFTDTSTAGSATITNNAGGYLYFNNTSTAGSATITNNGRLYFFDPSPAGSATITTNAGSSAKFYNTSSGGNARFIVNGSGAFDISGLAAAGMTAGSVEGAGRHHLGSEQLTVGTHGLLTQAGGA